MHYPIILIRKKLHVRGIALYPFIIFREKSFQHDSTIMNHELIHHRQQTELLIVPFYFFYLINYLLNRIKYRSHNAAYRNIVFEREAYNNQSNPEYLARRKLWAFLKFM